jgi:hypothetical protein
MTEASEARLYNLDTFRSTNSRRPKTRFDNTNEDLAEIINLRNRGIEISQKRLDESLRLSEIGLKKRSCELRHQANSIGSKAKAILIFRES